MNNTNNENVFQLLDLAIGEIHRAKNCVSCRHADGYTGNCIFLENNMCGALSKPYYEWRYDRFVKTVTDNICTTDCADIRTTDYDEADTEESSDMTLADSFNVGDALIIRNVGNCTVLAIRDNNLIVKTPDGIASIPKSSISDVVEEEE